MSKIGFVGVGRMGSNIARHLKDKGYAIGAIYDIRAEVENAWQSNSVRHLANASRRSPDFAT